MTKKADIFIESLKTALEIDKHFGIEIERQDFEEGEVINLERDIVDIVASNQRKAEDILMLLFNNLVSPIHLVDIVGEYADLCVNDFGF